MKIGIENPRVGGSIPSPATIETTAQARPQAGLFVFEPGDIHHAGAATR